MRSASSNSSALITSSSSSATLDLSGTIPCRSGFLAGIADSVFGLRTRREKGGVVLRRLLVRLFGRLLLPIRQLRRGHLARGGFHEQRESGGRRREEPSERGGPAPPRRDSAPR